MKYMKIKNIITKLTTILNSSTCWSQKHTIELNIILSSIYWNKQYNNNIFI